MKASILDLRRRMSDVLQALDRNEEVTILYRGRERAVLVPRGSNIKNNNSDSILAKNHSSFGLWSDNTAKDNVAEHIRSMRQNRYHDL